MAATGGWSALSPVVLTTRSTAMNGYRPDWPDCRIPWMQYPSERRAGRHRKET
jgi:hypothetical protein